MISSKGKRFAGRGAALSIRASAWILPALFLTLPAAGQGPPGGEACPPGVECKAKIMLGEGYVTGTESIESSITVLQIERGDKAWELLKATDPSNRPPAGGMEYVAARIRFLFGVRGVSEDLSYGIRDEQFASFSDSGKQYERPSVKPPKPELSGRLYPGDSLEGWLVFLVSAGDRKPLMSFGNNYYRVWLRLYQ